jgi:hypothetical protein
MHSLYKEKRNNIYKLIEVHFFFNNIETYPIYKESKKKKKKETINIYSSNASQPHLC